MLILQPTIAAPESVSRNSWTLEEALVEIFRGRLEGLGPVTVDELIEIFRTQQTRCRDWSLDDWKQKALSYVATSRLVQLKPSGVHVACWRAFTATR